MSSRRRIRSMARNRNPLPALDTLMDTANKYNFTPVLTSEQLDFTKNSSAETEIKFQETKMEISEEIGAIGGEVKKQLNVKEKKEIITAFKPPRSLVGAVSTKDITLLKEILEDKEMVDPNQQSQMNHALMLAITMRQTQMVEELLNAGADMHAFDEWYPVLLTAVDIRAMEVFDVLVARNTNVNVSSNYGNLMHSAARTGDVSLMERIAKLGVDINMSCKANGLTPLHEAVKSVRFNGKAWVADATKTSSKGTKRNKRGDSLDEKSDLLETNSKCDTTEMDTGPSESNYDLSAVDFLINNGSEINAKDHKGKTPLHEASIIGNKEVVQRLLDAGANPNTPDDSSNTPFMYALQQNHCKVAKLLIDDTKLNTSMIDDQYYAHLACKTGNFKTLQYLIEKGADMTLKHHGFTPLMVAITNNINEKCVSTLLQSDCGVNEVNDNGDTAVEILLRNWKAIPYSNELFQMMVSKGADVDRVHSETGVTPLIANMGNNEVISILLENGADINFVSKSGDNALYRACLNQNHHTINLLMEHNISMTLSDKVMTDGEHTNMTPLQISILNQNLQITNMLLCAGCSLRKVHTWIKDYEYCQVLRKDNPYYQKVFCYIESLQHGPSTLQNLSRLSILRAVVSVSCEVKTAVKVDQLCLPKMIKCCLPWSNYYACHTVELSFDV